MAGGPSDGKFSLTPSTGAGTPPSIDIAKSSLPSFTQSEGATPHADVKQIKPPPRKVAARDEEGDEKSKHPANCDGQANCGATAAPITQSQMSRDISGKYRAAQQDLERNGQDSQQYAHSYRQYSNFIRQHAKSQGAPPDVRMTHWPELPSPISPEIVKRGMLLPLGKDRFGKLRFAIPQGVIDFVKLPEKLVTASQIKEHYRQNPPTSEAEFAQQQAAERALIEGSMEAVLAASPAGLAQKGGGATLGSGMIRRGEPVSVATGEYLETWHDFLIPATLPFDGARYMGLKLPLPEGYANPLGPCQISIFDEIVSNPEPGQLEFHQADGKAIRFDRPFNFLASHNAGYPHLDLRAPWLRQLELRDRRQIKHFRQFDDAIYRLDRIEDLDGHAITFVRDPEGRLERAEGTDGLALAFENDGRGRRTGITLIGIDGSRLPLARYAYDARGRMTEATCAFGMSVDYAWEPERDLLAAWNNRTRRSQTRFTYDAEGRVSHTATNGIWNGDRFRYDPERRETTYLPGGTEALAQRFAYDASDNVTAEIDALGHSLTRVFDAAGFETALTDPNGHTTTKSYDLWGNPKSVVDPEGRSTEYGWGPEGQLDIVIDGAGHIRRYAHDERANVIEETDAEGHVTRHERDAGGRIVRTTFPDGAEERRGYDARGRLTTLTDPRGGITAYAYDAFGRPVAVTDAAGQTTRLAYEAGAGGFATPTTVVRPDGVSLQRTFTTDGVLATVTDGEGRTWRYSYGAFDVLTAIEDPRGGRLTLTHDGEGRITAVTNQNGLTYHLVRDAAGRVLAEEDFDGRRTEYTRDPAGRVTVTKKPDGTRLTYAYDRSDRLTAIRTFAADDPETLRPLDTTHLRYDGRGLLVEASSRAARIELERDGNGRIVAETTNGRRVESRLDELGRRIERRIGEGGPGASLVRIGRDPLGALASLAIDGHAPLAVSRDPLGRETRRASAKGFSLEQGFDPVGQLLHQRAGRDGQAGRAYTWDKAGAPTLIDDRLFGPATYRYDGNGQVAQARFGEGLTERFDYDAAKNVTGVSVEGPEAGADVAAGLGALLQVQSTPGGVVKLGHGPHGEQVALTHDACGRVIERRVERKGFRPRTWRYGWDVQDRLVRCVTPEGSVWHYRYDAFGRRLSKVREFSQAERTWVRAKHPGLLPVSQRDGTVLWTWPQAPGGQAAHDPRPPIVGTHFLWDGDVVAEEAPLRLDGSIDWEAATRWHYEPESYVPLAKQEADGRLAWIVTDHLGTPREMFDEAGRLRLAVSLTTWGVVRRVIVPPEPVNDEGRHALYPRSRTSVSLALRPEAEPDACSTRFQGQQADEETGLYYNRHRYYDAVAAQYVTSDPAGLAAGERLYGYVNNPTIWCDPLGLSARAAYQKPPATASANWSKARGDYWKSVGEQEASNPSGKYSPRNIDRMRGGDAPRITIEARSRRTGRTQTRDVSIELHHRSLPQRLGTPRANEPWNLEPATPWGHDGMDPFRHTGYDLIRVLKGTNSW